MTTKKILNTVIRAIKKIDKENFVLKLEFSNGKTETISLAHIFERPKNLASEIMRGELFDKCFVEMGCLAWPNGLEFCSDALLELAKKQKKAA